MWNQVYGTGTQRIGYGGKMKEIDFKKLRAMHKVLYQKKPSEEAKD